MQYIKTLPQHPRDWLRGRLKNRPANIICNKELLKEISYFNRKIKVNKTDKIERREAIIYKIVKQIPSDNDKYYVKHNKESDTCHIGKDEKIIEKVIESRANEENKNRKMIKRKIKESINEINQAEKNRKKHKISSQKKQKKKKLK